MIRFAIATAVLAAGALFAFPVGAQQQSSTQSGYAMVDDHGRDGGYGDGRRDYDRDDRHDDDHDRGRHSRDRDVSIVRCESIDNGRTYCRTSGSRSVTLVRRLSNASCIQGRGWGRGQRGLWVDRGCRAEFRLGR
jgi:Protein of unknown function (DUF3011)